MSFRKTTLVLAIAALAGCSAAADEDVSDSEAASSNAQLEGMWMRLPVPGLRLGQPIHSVTGTFPVSEMEDGRPDPCVGAMNVVPSGISNTVTYTAINSQRELLKELNLDLGVNVGANVAAGAAQASAEGSLNIVRSFKASATSGAFLFRARVVFEIGQGGGRWPRLAPTAPTGNVEEFVKKCGDRYVAGLRFGAEYNALIQYETSSVEQKNAITAGLTGRANGQGDVESRLGQLEARVRAQTSTAETESSVKLSILVQSVGLGTQTMPTYLCTTDRYDPVACAARAAMDLSRVLIEMGSMQQQLDRIQADLRSQPGVTFDQFMADNPQLVFPPIQEIAAANYADKATSVPEHIASELEEYGPFRQRLNNAKKVFDEVATTELRLDAAKTEIDTFLASPKKTTFGIYASAQAPALGAQQYAAMPTNPAGLEEIARQYAAKLDPLDAATPRSLLRNSVLQCRKAIENVTAPCTLETRVANGNVKTARDGALALLGDYSAKGRIVPVLADDLGMQYRTDAENLCRTRGKRLPNSDEGHRLEPLFGGRETWLGTGKGNPNNCTLPGVEWSAEGHAHDCRVYPFSKAVAICVPNDGPFNGAPML